MENHYIGGSCRLAYVGNFPRNYRRSDYSGDTLGLRLIRTLSPIQQLAEVIDDPK